MIPWSCIPEDPGRGKKPKNRDNNKESETDGSVLDNCFIVDLPNQFDQSGRREKIGFWMVLKSHIRSANNGSIFHGSRNPTKVALLNRENRPWNPQSLRCKCENPTTWLRTGIPWLERALIYLSSHQRRIQPKSERLRAVQFGTGALLEHPANVNSAHLNQLL